MRGSTAPPGGGAGGCICLQRPPARASCRLWGVRQRQCVSSLNLTRPPGSAVVLASGLSVVCGRCSLSACQARTGLQAEPHRLGSPALPSRSPGWAGVRRDPGGGPSWAEPSALWGLGAQPRKQCVHVCGGGWPPVVCRVEWPVTGQERGRRSKGRLRAPVRPRPVPAESCVHLSYVCRGPGCTWAAAWALPGAPVSPRVVSGLGGVLPVPRGPRISSAGYWVPARPPHVWGPACPTPGGSSLGPHPARTGGFTLPAPGAPPGLGARLGLSDIREEQGVSLTDLGDPQIGRPVG